MFQYLQPVVLAVRSFAIISAFGFALAELKGKKRHIAGLIVSATLALTAEMAQWGINIYQKRSSQQITHELIRARYPIGKFNTAITLWVPSDEPAMQPYITRWENFVRDKLRERQSHHPSPEEWWISDEALGVGVQMSGERPVQFNFSRESSLLVPMETRAGFLTDFIKPEGVFFAFASDCDLLLAAKGTEELWKQYPGCDLAVLLYYAFDETRSYDVEYLVKQHRVQIMAQDSAWGIVYDTGAITSYVDLPGRYLAIVLPFSDAELKDITLFAGAGDMSFGHGKSLELRGDLFKKDKRWNQTIFTYRLKRSDVGILKSIEPDQIEIR